MEKGTKLRVTFELELPCKADEPEIREWIEYELGFANEIWANNVFDQYGLEATRVQIERV